MATIAVTIPNEKATEIMDALCESYGWTAQSGLTKPQFAKKVVADFVKQVYYHHAGTKASEAAKVQAQEAIKNIDIN